MDVTQVIDAFGGYQQSQTLFGVSRGLLARWEEEGIPPKRWPQIVELARRLDVPGIDVETLAGVRPSKPKAAA